jgi:hypothetical protein
MSGDTRRSITSLSLVVERERKKERKKERKRGVTPFTRSLLIEIVKL